MRGGKQNNRGAALVTLLVFVGIALYITTAFVSWAGTSVRAGRQLENKEQAFHIAEAGLEYYRWYVAHSGIQPGESPPVPPPLVVYDAEGNVVGTAEYTVTSPVPGSTVIQIDAEGSVTGTGSGTNRTLRTQLAIPSFARYSLASNDDVRLGEGTETFGEIHANGGVRFDGFANNVVTSAKETYDDPDHFGSFEFGVHTHVSPVDPIPPASVPERPDVFGAGRVFPVPQVDFAGITQDLSNLKSKAQANGHYFAPSGRRGYEIRFNSNNTFDIWEVRSLYSLDWLCAWYSSAESTWTVRRTRNRQTYNMPDNGVIFVEDNVWVRGQVDGARVTVAAGVFPDTPATRPNILITENLQYTNHDGTDAIALISQNDITVGFYAEDTLLIDGALIAQNGRVGREYYSPVCGTYTYRDSITVTGMIASYIRYGFAYTDGTGYDQRNLIYDANLLYAPPPEFPLTSDEHEILTWEELE